MQHGCRAKPLLKCPITKKKLSDDNLASESVEKQEFVKPITIEEIVIFMIKSETSECVLCIIIMTSRKISVNYLYIESDFDLRFVLWSLNIAFDYFAFFKLSL